jgi:hypothetical protein
MSITVGTPVQAVSSASTSSGSTAARPALQVHTLAPNNLGAPNAAMQGMSDGIAVTASISSTGRAGGSVTSTSSAAGTTNSSSMGSGSMDTSSIDTSSMSSMGTMGMETTTSMMM